ncbi:beta-N-acetylhexosaminidase [Alicyclobacillus acidiphilus]|uniref:beta-N-acetylhexosaminidase n=1 Tax=Alicyclobacillus acidiphilus TaxID=182455 RepID=UPI000A3EFFFF|nr:beta-N-acetylhexosaminidase [Alicyclobacillus acidiphilus]
MDEQHVRDLIGDVVIAGFPSTRVDDHVTRLVAHHRVKNIILFSRNIVSITQIRQLTEDLQQLARSSGFVQPLIISADQENGIVRRLGDAVPGLPGNMAIGAARSTNLAREMGRVTALQLRYAGINMNLAPVLDVNNNPDNPVIGVRSFGESPQWVASLGAATIAGLQEQGVIACGKHFPGHGDTAVDSHLALPLVNHARSRLDEVELVPFVKAIQSGVDSLMSAHVVFPAVEPDGVPATLSRRVLTDFLRHELQFDGMVTTDCLEMNAISEEVGVGEGAVRALLAGADMLMISHRLDRQEEAIESLVAAVLSGRVPYERLAEAAERVRKLKSSRLAVSEQPLPSWDELVERSGEMQRRASSQAVTLVRDDHRLLPVNPDKYQHITVLLDPNGPHMAAADDNRVTGLLGEAVKRAFPSARVDVRILDENEDANQIGSDSNRVDLAVIGLHRSAAKYVERLQRLMESGIPTIVVALQSPYVLRHVPQGATQFAIYEHTPWMVEAVVQAMQSGIANRALPVTIS